MVTLNKFQYNILVNKGLQAHVHSLNGFAEACYDDNNYEDLVNALDSVADAADCKNWHITAQEWKESIKQALEVSMYCWCNSLYISSVLNKRDDNYK